MAKQQDILERRNSLKKFIYDKGNGKLKFESIQKFYSESYGNEKLSDSTIRTDLQKIGVKCNKRTNTYYFKHYEDILNSKKLLEDLLRDCTMYKPFRLAEPLKTSSFIYNDNNPSINLNCIIIKSKSRNNSTLIPKFISELNNFYSLKEQDLYIDLNLMDIVSSKYYLKFIFDDPKSLKIFYKDLYQLRYGDYSADKPIIPEF